MGLKQHQSGDETAAVPSLLPSAERALEIWAQRVRANREQVDRFREVPDGSDFYAPIASHFREDPRRSDEAALEALRGPQDFIGTMNAEFDKRRTYMVKRLNAMPGVSCLMPVGAFYAFPRVSSHYGKSASGKVIKNSSDLATYLLEDAHVALVSGDAFGADAYIRLSYATSMESITKGLDRIENALAKLK